MLGSYAKLHCIKASRNGVLLESELIQVLHVLDVEER